MGQWLKGQGVSQLSAELIKWENHLSWLTFLFLIWEMEIRRGSGIHVIGHFSKAPETAGHIMSLR